MKLLPFTIVVAICYQSIVQAVPVGHEGNEIDSKDEATHSSEIMPGRDLTSQEIKNLIYITHQEVQKPYKPRQKRFIFAHRNWAERLQQRQERIRLRNERRRLQYENRRLHQQASLLRLNQQNALTRQRLQNLNFRTQQTLNALNTPLRNTPFMFVKPYVLPGTGTINTIKPTSIQTVAPAQTSTTIKVTPAIQESTTTSASTSTSALEIVDSNKQVQQVPLPKGNK